MTLAQLGGLEPAALAKSSAALATAATVVTKAEADPSTEKSSLPTLRRKLAQSSDELRQHITPLYERWFDRTLALPDGATRLMDMRATLLDISSKLDANARRGDTASRIAAEGVRPVLECLTVVLRRWSSVAWLVVDEMSWEKVPAVVVERIVTTEAVHKFQNMEDVRRRMQPSPNRHAFAFFHANVIGEPLAMVFVALTRGICNNVTEILETGGSSRLLDYTSVPGSHPIAPPQTAEASGPDTAIFYSITSTQEGLRGIELGNFLIKGVVNQLRAVRPSITQFSTLSPIPGYTKWLKGRAAAQREDTASGGPDAAVRAVFGDADEIPGLAAAAEKACPSIKISTEPAAACEALLGLFGSAQWFSEAQSDELRRLLMCSVHSYLTQAKHRGRPVDSVAAFHLKNGATLHRLNWMANRSIAGGRSSGCIMVNYLYDLNTVSSNAAAFADSGAMPISTDVATAWTT